MLVDTTFIGEPNGPVDGSQHWQLVAGALGAMTFGHLPVNASIGVATSKVKHVLAPERNNQSVEIGFQFDVGAQYYSLVLGDLPVAYYRLDESSGVAMVDSFGTYTGSYSGGYTFGQASALTTDADASTSFNGSTGYSSVPYNAPLNPAAFTVECWAKFNGSSSGIKAIVESQHLNKGYSLRINGANWEFAVFDGATAHTVSGGGYVSNTWTHLVATYDGTQARLYVNGILTGGPTTMTLSANTTAALKIATDDAQASWFTGTLDEVSVYNYALNQTQITSHYNAATFGNLASSLYTGCFLRWKDANNNVLARVSHISPKGMDIIETVGGAQVTTTTLAYPGGASATGAMKLELINKRLRVWYEAGPVVQDRPPDLALNLKGAPATGSWGMHMAANGPNGMFITHFAASNLPSAVMPTPQCKVVDASGLGPNFSAVTAAISFPYTTGQTEWEIYPVDPADYPEAYRDLTDVSITSRVLWVRTGYNYDFRIRNVTGNGPGPWSDYVRLSAIGSPAVLVPGQHWAAKMWATGYWAVPHWAIATNVVAPVAPDTFPNVVPDYLFEGQDTSQPTTVVSQTGHERVSVAHFRPRRSWKMTFDHRTSAEFQAILDFWNYAQAKNLPFTWTHPTTAEIFTLRFESDDYESVYEDHNDVSGPLVGVSFQVMEASINVVPPVFPVRLAADPALF